MKIISHIIVFGIIIALMDCKKDNSGMSTGTLSDSLFVANCNTQIITFDIDVAPIIFGNCAVPGCHVNPAPINGIALETYEQVKFYGENGMLDCTIRWMGDCTPMPNAQEQLTIKQIQTIECWIVNGMIEK